MNQNLSICPHQVPSSNWSNCCEFLTQDYLHDQLLLVCRNQHLKPIWLKNGQNVSWVITYIPLAVPCGNRIWETYITCMPKAFMWCSSWSSLMRPLTAKRALDGTQPLFTHVPPITSPSMIAVFRPCHVLYFIKLNFFLIIQLKLGRLETTLNVYFHN